jgi:uncharacterized protein YdaL
VSDRAVETPRASARGVRWIPFGIILAILLVVTIPSLLERGSSEPLAPLRLPAVPAPPGPIPVTATRPAEASVDRSALVLYDRTGRWGWLGELYATMAGNLVSHFGRWTAKPVAHYRAGDLARHTAAVYVGSTYGEHIPDAFLADVLRSKRPVVWLNHNIQRLVRAAGDFRARYGWLPHRFDRSAYSTVRYRGTTLTRWTRRTGGVMTYSALDPSRVDVLARAMRRDGRSVPWAVRSRSLTYVGEIPFPYTSETDRVLAFADLLFDVLAPRTPERHRALLRIEDINPLSDPDELRDVADYLHGEGIPFGFGVSPRYRDPTGEANGGEPRDVLLRDRPALVAALDYLQRKGGVLVGHGYTHQWDGGANPYNGATGDDVEFLRVTETPDGQVQYRGPLRGDSQASADRRVAFANREFQAAGFRPPRIFEFPHYAASVAAYRAVARRFAVRWERSFYYSGILRGRTVDHRRFASQFFPYVVRDVYGSKVLPENLGSVTPERWKGYRERSAEDIVTAARANLVVRDGFASFFFHPFLDLRLLQRTVNGIRELGYEFVSPASL